ncbi:MAG: abortive infection family protein [Candidatus Cloacimonetes bacterium]|nr:abortive infection family protein [Candidatus Cloacimonadota bacterium]
MELIKCPLCHFQNAKKVKTYNFEMQIWFNCPKCGFFVIKDYQVNGHNYFSYSKIKELIFTIKKISNESNYIELDYENLENIVNQVHYPKSIEDKTDILLSLIINNEKELNNGYSIGSEHLNDLALETSNALRGLIDFAVEKNFIKTDTKFADGGAQCLLTIRGRKRLEELDQLSKIEKNRIIIVKNSNFSQTMTKALESAENEIVKGNPDLAHDRMHTFIHDYFIQLCAKLSLNPNSNRPDILELFSLIQQHLNKIDSSKVSITILRSMSKILKEINDIRNNKSLSHPNPILKKPEALFVINTVKTIYVYLEERVK